MNKHARWYDGSLGSKLGQNISRHIVVPRDVVELQTVKLGFELLDLPAVGVHFLLSALPVLVDLLYDDFGVSIGEKLFDAEGGGDPETVDEGLVLGCIVGLEE